jgi:hypothetical protein
MDLLVHPLPKVDLILCRGLVHFSFDDIFRALQNLCASGSRFSWYLDEGRTEGGGEYADKAFGLWRLSDVRAALNRSSRDKILALS